MSRYNISSCIKPIRLQYKSETGIDLYDLENEGPTSGEQLYTYDGCDDEGEDSYIDMNLSLNDLFPEVVNYINWLENKHEK